MMYSAFDLMLTQLWQVTVLILLALLMERLCGKKLPHLMAGIWLAIVVKCLVPPILSSPTGLFSWAGVSISSGTHERPVPPSAGLRQSMGITLLMIWAMGATLVLVNWFYRWRQFASCLQECRSDAALQERLDQWSGVLKLKTPARILISQDDIGPLTTGILQPIIVLPEKIVRESNLKHLDPVIAHELVHVRRHDSLLGIFQMVATLCFWFHPLVRWAMQRMDLNIERCVDSEVISELKFDANNYANGLLRVVKLKSRMPIMRGLAYMSPMQISKDRIKHVMTSVHARSRLASRFVTVLMILFFLPGRPLKQHPWQLDHRLPFSICESDDDCMGVVPTIGRVGAMRDVRS